jgi:toxin ParE1/3/4
MLYLDEQANEETALRYYEAVLATCGLIAQQPLSGRTLHTTATGLERLRRFPVSGAFGTYLIFYQPGPIGIDVIRVLHGSRDIGALMGAE